MKKKHGYRKHCGLHRKILGPREPYIWFRDCYWQDVCTKWIRVTAYLAQKHGAKTILPFFTEQFVYYNKCYGKCIED